MAFDHLAPYYPWLEKVLAGRLMQRCRTALIAELPPVKNILLLGEGPGRALVVCRQNFPTAEITCLDASARMLDQARRQLVYAHDSLERVRFLHADVLAWSPPVAAYDLIITNFFLDCFRADQLEQIIPGIASAALSDAHWLIADFQIPPAGFRRLRSRLILSALYLFFRVTTGLPARRLTPPDAYLARARFKLQRRCEFDLGLCHADWWRRCD